MLNKSIQLILQQLQNPSERKILVASPMAGISNRPFRKMMRKLGSDISVSELISAKGLVYGGTKTIHMIQMCEEERPVGIQLFGEDVPNLCEAAKIDFCSTSRHLNSTAPNNSSSRLAV